MLYMSWNGATKITSWLIFARESEPGLKIDAMLKSMEFGTMFEIHGSCEKDLKVPAYRDRSLWVSEHCGGYFTGRKTAD